MSIAIQGAGSATHYCVECDCCGRIVRSQLKFNRISYEPPEKWAAGSFNGKVKHICDFCLTEQKTGDKHMEWRW